MSEYWKEKTPEEIKEEQERLKKEDEFKKRKLLIESLAGTIIIPKTKYKKKSKAAKKPKHQVHFYNKEGEEIFPQQNRQITEFFPK